MSESLKSKTVSGVLWSAIERFSLQGVQFIINILMARLLLPSDYGMIGMLAVFLQISQTFIDSGFSDALVQKKDRTETDLSTVFICKYKCQQITIHVLQEALKMLRLLYFLLHKPTSSVLFPENISGVFGR